MNNHWFAVATPKGTNPQNFFDAGCSVTSVLKPYITSSEFNRKSWFIRINKETFVIEGRASVDVISELNGLPHCYQEDGQHPSDYMSFEEFLDTYVRCKFNENISIEEVLAG